MKKRMISIVLVMLLISTFCIAMSTNAVNTQNLDEEEPGEDLTYILDENITLVIKTDKKEYNQGDPVKISFQLTNIGEEDIIIKFPDSYTHDFEVYKWLTLREAKSLWKIYQWSYGKRFFTSSTIEIPTGKTHYKNFTWDQKGRLFPSLPSFFNHRFRPGTYYVFGFIPNVGYGEKYTAYTSFSIIRQKG